MLDGTRDAAGDVKLGTDGNAGLSNLSVVVAETSVNGGAAGTHFATNHVGEFVEHVKVFAAAHAVATGNDDGGAFDVNALGVDLAANHLEAFVLVAEIFGSVDVDELAFAVGVDDFFAHDAFTNGGHLRACFGANDGCHDVAAESGTDLIEDVVVFLAGFEVSVVADFKGSAVSGEAAAQMGGNAGCEVAADAGGTIENHFGLTFADDAVHNAEMRQGAVRRETGIVGVEDGIDTIGI